eukprot:TRINITY_DN5361_c0_g1_i2.p1 TRINITY_DN5361_c0_g1~~TRINITY_DN5361_c0_g1_i2.p1  ORF type:complete len:426 (-),score=67.38 TRINITY_DN5361_c0_g1_i2:463-1668(-)
MAGHSLNSIPDDAIWSIFSLLSIPDLLSIRSTCWTMYHIVSDDLDLLCRAGMLAFGSQIKRVPGTTAPIVIDFLRTRQRLTIVNRRARADAVALVRERACFPRPESRFDAPPYVPTPRRVDTRISDRAGLWSMSTSNESASDVLLQNAIDQLKYCTDYNERLKERIKLANHHETLFELPSSDSDLLNYAATHRGFVSDEEGLYGGLRFVARTADSDAIERAHRETLQRGIAEAKSHIDAMREHILVDFDLAAENAPVLRVFGIHPVWVAVRLSMTFTYEYKDARTNQFCLSVQPQNGDAEVELLRFDDTYYEQWDGHGQISARSCAKLVKWLGFDMPDDMFVLVLLWYAHAFNGMWEWPWPDYNRSLEFLAPFEYNKQHRIPLPDRVINHLQLGMGRRVLF